jgi:hypothetical protein
MRADLHSARRLCARSIAAIGARQILDDIKATAASSGIPHIRGSSSSSKSPRSAFAQATPDPMTTA